MPVSNGWLQGHLSGLFYENKSKIIKKGRIK